MSRLDVLSNSAKEALKEQGFEDSKIHTERYLNMRFDGTDNAIMVLAPSANDGSGIQDETDFETAFKRSYKGEFGFLLEGKAVIVDDIKVRGVGKTFDSLGESVYEELRRIQKNDTKEVLSKKDGEFSVYFGDRIGRVDNTPVYQLGKLDMGDVVHGPAILIDDTQTIVVVPKSEAVVTSRHLYITLHD
jgi:5-oxoprolinase (ATP-hydrolysing)